MVLTVFGINHRTATLSEREPFQLGRSELGEAVLLYKRITRVDEAAIIATCNRIEFYRVHGKKGRHGLEVVEFYRARGVSDPERVLELAYRHVGAAAARHLFRVTSGMDSLVVGEDQVRGQVKDAYSTGCAFGGPGKVLHKLFHHAFRVSKRIKNETALGSGIRSVPGAAVDLLLQQAPGTGRALVIGVNETTELLAGSVVRRGVDTVIINRTDYAADKLAAAHGAEARKWAELTETANSVGLIFSATGSPGFVLRAADIAGRPEKEPLLLADLAIPRDIDPEIGRIEGVRLFDLQDLKHHLEMVNDQRSAQFPKAQGIIEQQVDEFLEWMHAQSFAGGIEAVKQDLHQAADEELKRFLPGFRQGESKALEAFSHALIKRFIKIAHHHFEPGDVGDRLVARTDPAAVETDGIGMTFVPAMPEVAGEKKKPAEEKPGPDDERKS